MKIKFNQLKVISDYAAWLMKHYQMLQQKTQQIYFYKVIDKEICKKRNEKMLVIQVAGKNVFLKMSPKEIAADDDMLRGFSPLDIRTIIYFACKKHFEAKQQKAAEPKRNILYRIVAQTFLRRQKKQMLVIEQVDQAEVITTSVQAASNNPEMIDGFSPRDAHRVGYAAGVEAVLHEKELSPDFESPIN
jgi:endo-alpha-1,4-polygalactosaminidase (GH114 family)